MILGYLILGAVLLTIVVIDVLWTTLWIAGGAGPITSRLMAWTWRVLRKIGRKNSLFLSLSGPLILSFSLLVWIVFLWGGWTLIFASAETALSDTLNRGPISWSDRVYFTGYTIFTLGIGDLVPREGVWQLLTILATGSGLLLLTLSITYMLSLLDAVTQKRSLASNIYGLGTTSTEIIRRSWNEEEFRELELPLHTFTTQLNTLTTNHKAYPILHYFHSQQESTTPTISIIVLDEALTLLRFGIPEAHQPNEIILHSARTSVQNYLGTLHHTFVDSADRTPPAPDLASLREVNIPTVSDEEFASSLDELNERRRTLLGIVESDAREWPSPEED
ncbi:ion channel [Halosolutus gelatinilyticus]|uniref:ion channel n=1 Tax=Halosolutus gelatinilyticus TaxID=2931975 RepID=UPI001FF35E52|nr:ion channel [Halosolutus gelatinilyticus]